MNKNALNLKKLLDFRLKFFKYNVIIFSLIKKIYSKTNVLMI
jgi:hypothetical protein